VGVVNVLIDTHILILREFSKSVPRRVQDLFKILNSLSIKVVLHPLAKRSIKQDKNIIDSKILLSKLDIYPVLESPPNPNDNDKFLRYFGKATTPEENVDQNLLFCIYKNKADILITEDPKIHENAGQIGIGDKVLSLKEAVLFFQDSIKYNALKNKSDREQIYFCKKGEKWVIGAVGREKFFKDVKGFQFIHFLLSHPNEEISPATVYHLGVVDTDTLSKGDYEGLSWDAKKLEKVISKDGAKAVLERVNILKKELKETEIDDPDQKIKSEEEIAFLEKEIKKYKSKKLFKDSDFENVRTNVTKHIKKILEKLNKEMPDLEPYLGIRTITTGSKMSYNIPINNPPEWIL